MDIAKLIRAILVPDLDRKLPDPRSLRPGDLVNGKVTARQPDGRVMVDFGNFKAQAQVDFPVQEGQRLQMVVVKNGPKLWLRVDPGQQGRQEAPPLAPKTSNGVVPSPGVPEPVAKENLTPERSGQPSQKVVPITANDLKSLRSNIERLLTTEVVADSGKSPPAKIFAKLRPVLTALSRSLQPLDLEVAARQIAPNLERMVADSGVFLEKKLAALSLQPEVPATIGEVATKIVAQINTLLRHSPPQALTGPKAAALLIPLLKPLELDNRADEMLPRLESMVRESRGKLSVEPIRQLLMETIRQEAAPTPQPAQTFAPDTPAKLFGRNRKALLIRVKHQLDELVKEQPRAESRPMTQVRSIVAKMIAHVEGQQRESAAKLESPEIVQAFTHVLPIKQENMQAALKVFYRKRQRDDLPQNPRVSILLDMVPMGSVRSDLFLVNRDLEITFYVDREETRKFLEDHFGLIRAGLGSTFQNLVIRAQISQRKSRQFDAHGAGTQSAGAPLGKVDIRI